MGGEGREFGRGARVVLTEDLEHNHRSRDEYCGRDKHFHRQCIRKDGGYTVMELILYLALLIAASWLLIGGVTPWKKVETVTRSRVASDIQSIRQAAYQWRDERSAANFTGISLQKLEDAGILSATGTNSNIASFEVVPDPGDSSLVRVEITLLRPNDDPASWRDGLVPQLRGVYEQVGIVNPDRVWFSF